MNGRSYPLSVVIGPDALLYGAELSRPQRLGDHDGVGGDDMLAGGGVGRRHRRGTARGTTPAMGIRLRQDLQGKEKYINRHSSRCSTEEIQPASHLPRLSINP